jgi:hypothetical protein
LRFLWAAAGLQITGSTIGFSRAIAEYPVFVGIGSRCLESPVELFEVFATGTDIGIVLCDIGEVGALECAVLAAGFVPSGM